MPSVAVVLGAGGIVGGAFHAGVLTALAEAGFDARCADLLVGTSAGSGVAAVLRAGFPPLDLAARNTGRPLSRDAAAIVGRAKGPPVFDFRPRPFSRPPVPASPRLLLHAGRHPAKALAGLLPQGTISTDAIGERIGAIYSGRIWPEERLWICAVDLDRGDRVVFGRDELSTPVGIAVQASSSIPGFFRPVQHEGRRYVDGGVHSPTNADLLRNSRADLVVVVSPMSAARAGRRSSRVGTRALHSAQLSREVRRLEDVGLAVLTIEPTSSDLVAMGRNPMDARRGEVTTNSALASTRKRLADPSLADHLQVLRSVS
ncbi:MAG: patatin-like phospholipase family protein [Actinomycetia bacterium]|nr:patatin-like phospholipase family protein [Actinomycetes bacterium]